MSIRASLTIAVAALLILTCSREPAEAATVDLSGSLDLLYAPESGVSLPYRLYVPESVDQSRGNPLVVFLHGWDEKGTDNEIQLRQAGGLVTAARRFNSFLLAPQVPIGGNWIADTITSVAEIVQLTQQQYGVNSDRIYVTGYSMGGFGTFNAMLLFPEIFGAGVPMHSSMAPQLGNHFAHIPTWGFNGEFDGSAPRMKELLEVMALAGLADVRYTELAGLGHAGWEQVYEDANGELYPWLFSQGIVSTPLPAAAWLMLSGLAALGLLRRRNRRPGASCAV